MNPSSFVISCAIFSLPLTQHANQNLISHHSPMVQPMQRHVLAEEDLIDGYAQVFFPCHHFYIGYDRQWSKIMWSQCVHLLTQLTVILIALKITRTKAS